MTLVNWRPNRNAFGLQNEMNRLFDHFLGNLPYDERESASSSAWQPRVDIKENDDEFVLFAELPGLKKEDIHVVYKDGVVSIEGERKQVKEDKKENFHRVERFYGKFCRNFELPTLVKQEKINAKYADGILELHLPKADEVKPKEIEVNIS